MITVRVINSKVQLSYTFVNFETSEIVYHTVYIITYCPIVTYNCMICDIEFGHVMAALHLVYACVDIVW